MKTKAKEECKSCEFDYKVNSSIGVCNALDCKGTRDMMKRIDGKRKKRNKPFFTTYEPKFYLNKEGGKRE